MPERTTAIILAGGKGTRLSRTTRAVPKPMLPIGDKPLLEHQIRLLKRFNCKRVIILVSHLKECIIDYFGNGDRFGMEIEYYAEPHPLGTVGGIKEIENRLSGDFLVLYGDVMMDMDLSRLISFHRKKQSQCTLVLHPNDHPYDSDLVETDSDDRVTAFHAKPHPAGTYYRNLVNAGAYVLGPEIFKHIEKGKKADFGRDVFPAIYRKLPMYGYNTPEYLKDMGTPERLEQVRADLEFGKIARKSLVNRKKTIFMDRDGVLNHDVNFIHRLEDLLLYDFAPKAVRKINESDYLAIIVTNQSAIARNICTIDELERIHKKLETELGNRHTKIDRIYFCPHHPEKGFPEENPRYKIECECRKPKPGMLIQAALDYNIDLSQSYMIGDSERDIVAGKRAGCKTIGVMTGNGMQASDIAPDYFCKDLLEAVCLITGGTG